jgi:hypothetical protein
MTNEILNTTLLFAACFLYVAITSSLATGM